MSEAICSVEACTRRVHCKAMCSMHYARLVRNGTTDDIRPPCPVDECVNRCATNGTLCATHRNRARRSVPMSQSMAPCSVHGCERETYVFVRYRDPADLRPAGVERGDTGTSTVR